MRRTSPDEEEDRTMREACAQFDWLAPCLLFCGHVLACGSTGLVDHDGGAGADATNSSPEDGGSDVRIQGDEGTGSETQVDSGDSNPIDSGPWFIGDSGAGVVADAAPGADAADSSSPANDAADGSSARACPPFDGAAIDPTMFPPCDQSNQLQMCLISSEGYATCTDGLWLVCGPGYGKGCRMDAAPPNGAACCPNDYTSTSMVPGSGCCVGDSYVTCPEYTYRIVNTLGACAQGDAAFSEASTD